MNQTEKQPNIEIRECLTVEEFNQCVLLQREVFGLPDLEISPSRHLVVTKHAGGFTLGAFAENLLVGFVLSVPMFRGEEKAFYSHMTAVKKEFQNFGIGGKLKWAQRTKALELGINYIKWTFQPIQARNAFFNLNRLGATVKTYCPNFYGTDYATESKLGIDSDRLFADWDLLSEKVNCLATGQTSENKEIAVQKIEIPNDWNELLKTNPQKAIDEQNRIKNEFQEAFAKELICKSFERDEQNPKYLLYQN